eukprot:m.203098 g.203098  ORF g.203098 m.203098 type:complete len:52 (+) comp14986_c0_seq11:598-753(+)
MTCGAEQQAQSMALALSVTEASAQWQTFTKPGGGMRHCAHLSTFSTIETTH